jgi:hypothetical protein
MKAFLFFFLYSLSLQFSYAQEVKALDSVAILTNECLVENKEVITKKNQRVFLLECLENATEKHVDLLLKHYNISEFKELDISVYVQDMLPYLSRHCGIKEKKLKAILNEWIN